MDEIKTVSHLGSDLAFDTAVNALLAEGWHLREVVPSPLRVILMRESP